MKANSIRICGRNTSTLPVPATTPSRIRPRSGPRRQQPGQPGAQGGDALVDPRLRCLGPAEHRLEHQEQHHPQQQRTCHRVQHHLVEPGERGHARRHAVAGRIQHAAHLALRGLDVGGGGGRRALPGARAHAAAPVRRSGSRRSPRPARARRRSARRPCGSPGCRAPARARRGRAGSRAARPTSLMLRATSIGRPRRLSSSTRRRFRRRLVASTTQTAGPAAARSHGARARRRA